MSRPFLVLAIFAVSACSGGGGAPDTVASATTPVTLYHASGRIAAQGHYLTGTTTRTGAWTEHFDVEDAPVRYERTYTAGVWDESQPWREWNVDGSLREDADDR